MIARDGTGVSPARSGMTGAEDDGVAAILAAEARRNAALLAADPVALGELLADDLTYVHATGRHDDKAGLLAGLARGVRYLRAERSRLRVRRLGEVAIMTGWAEIVVQRSADTAPIPIGALVSQVWVERGGRWQMIAYHGSIRPEGA